MLTPGERAPRTREGGGSAPRVPLCAAASADGFPNPGAGPDAPLLRALPHPDLFSPCFSLSRLADNRGDVELTPSVPPPPGLADASAGLPGAGWRPKAKTSGVEPPVGVGAPRSSSALGGSASGRSASDASPSPRWGVAAGREGGGPGASRLGGGFAAPPAGSGPWPGAGGSAADRGTTTEETLFVTGLSCAACAAKAGLPPPVSSPPPSPRSPPRPRTPSLLPSPVPPLSPSPIPRNSSPSPPLPPPPDRWRRLWRGWASPTGRSGWIP